MKIEQEHLEKLIRIPRKHKRVILCTMDTAVLAAAFIMSGFLSTGNIEIIQSLQPWVILGITLAISITTFAWLGLYKAIVRFMSHRLMGPIIVGCAVSALTIYITNMLLGNTLPTSTAAIFFMLGIFSVGGSRIWIRKILESNNQPAKAPVIIYGAGEAGSQLVTSLRRGKKHLPVAFVDDWKGMKGTYVEGLMVHSPFELPSLVKEYRAQRILLAMPSVPRARRREIITSLESLEIAVQTVPGMEDVITGKAKVSEVRDVAVEDLLGRDPVAEDVRLMTADISGKVVMITGAGGSIGSELCRQAVKKEPHTLILLDISENALYNIEKELREITEISGASTSIKPIIGSIQQKERIDSILACFNVNTIYHAAAYKHVPMVEYNVIEGIRNNVFGTLMLAETAIKNKVDTFIMVSTDKAVRPTNIMGTSKRLAEMICQALADDQGSTRFCMVRFGNVLGSSGSVVPLFRRQIDNGGPVTVTHPDITRFFMTIPEAAQLVIQAGAMGKSGDLFLLDMGEPVRIVDLARDMIRLSGLEEKNESNPDGDIEIVFSGLRPGEKLFEELIIDNTSLPTEHPRIMMARERHWNWAQLQAFLVRLEAAVKFSDYRLIRDLLKEAPTAYQPKEPLSDLIWMQSTRPYKHITMLETEFTKVSDVNS